jgi:hypothetical protein
MKYKDKGFLNHQEKQRDGEVGYWYQKSDRQLRREKEHRFSTFYQQYLISCNGIKNESPLIDKFWWKNLKDSDKEKIMSLRTIQSDYIISRFNAANRWYSDPVFETWSEWYDYITSTFKPNRILLREDKLKAIGI